MVGSEKRSEHVGKRWKKTPKPVEENSFLRIRIRMLMAFYGLFMATIHRY